MTLEHQRHSSAASNDDSSSLSISTSTLSGSTISGHARVAQTQIEETKTPSVSEILSDEHNPAFDDDALVSQPMQTANDREIAFRQELSRDLLRCMLKTHAWASARSAHELNQSQQEFGQDVESIQQQEVQQDMMRQKLADFIRQIRAAIEVLTGIVPPF